MATEKFFQLRLTKDQHGLIRAAAFVAEKSINQFILDAVLKEARTILQSDKAELPKPK